MSNKIYIAGKISGDEHYRAKFRLLSDKLAAIGGTVLNPAELPGGMDKADYMAICLQMLLRADGAVFLPDWESSPGAKIEHALARYIGVPCWHLGDNWEGGVLVG